MKTRYIKTAVEATAKLLQASPAQRKQRLQTELGLAEERLSHLMAEWDEYPSLDKLLFDEADAVRAISQYGYTALGQLAGCKAAFASCALCERTRGGDCKLYEHMWHAKHSCMVALSCAEEVDGVKDYIGSIEDELARLEQASWPRVRGTEDGD